MAQHSETFGPFSDPIDLRDFLDYARKLADGQHDVWSIKKYSIDQIWSSLLPEAAQIAVERECQVDDILTESTAILENNAINSHVLAERLGTLNSLYRESDREKKKKRKRTGGSIQPEEGTHPDVAAFQKYIAGTSLSWWRLPLEASHFIRKSKLYEHNALSTIKSFLPTHDEDISEQISDSGLALLTITVYNRTSTSPFYVHRSSTHVFLSTQTLGDLYDVMPCPSKEQPSEVRNDGGILTGYDAKKLDMSGCVICVAGTAYGDGLEISDYADKLCQHLKETESELSSSIHPTINLKRGTNIHDVSFSSLKLTLHYPNWILHHGSCEHYFVVDQVRLQHSSDPRLGYPLTVFVAPPNRWKCRLCENLPAAFSLVNDLRMPDTPFLICMQCMETVGTVTNKDALVVPLIEHITW